MIKYKFPLIYCPPILTKFGRQDEQKCKLHTLLFHFLSVSIHAFHIYVTILRISKWRVCTYCWSLEHWRVSSLSVWKGA